MTQFRSRDDQVASIHEATAKQVCSRRTDYPADVYRAYLEAQIKEAEARGAAEAILKMANSTEQKAIEDRKEGKRGEAFWRLCLVNALTDPESWDADEARKHIDRIVDEFKEVGAAEERGKVAEGQQPAAWMRPDELPSQSYPWYETELHLEKSETYSMPIYTRPDNVADLEARIKELEGESSSERRFHHIKRGTEYRLIGRGKIQQNGPSDMADVIIYQDVNDGGLWVRSPAEFYDGRFKEVFVSTALKREGGV